MTVDTIMLVAFGGAVLALVQWLSLVFASQPSLVKKFPCKRK